MLSEVSHYPGRERMMDNLTNPFGCASPISFPVYAGVAPSIAANEAESVK